MRRLVLLAAAYGPDAQVYPQADESTPSLRIYQAEDPRSRQPVGCRVLVHFDESTVEVRYIAYEQAGAPFGSGAGGGSESPRSGFHS